MAVQVQREVSAAGSSVPGARPVCAASPRHVGQVSTVAVTAAGHTGAAAGGSAAIADAGKAKLRRYLGTGPRLFDETTAEGAEELEDLEFFDPEFVEVRKGRGRGKMSK